MKSEIRVLKRSSVCLLVFAKLIQRRLSFSLGRMREFKGAMRRKQVSEATILLRTSATTSQSYLNTLQLEALKRMKMLTGKQQKDESVKL